MWLSATKQPSMAEVDCILSPEVERREKIIIMCSVFNLNCALAPLICCYTHCCLETEANRACKQWLGDLQVTTAAELTVYLVLMVDPKSVEINESLSAVFSGLSFRPCFFLKQAFPNYDCPWQAF